jgi:guanine deaminase
MNKWMQIAFNEATEGILKNDGGPFRSVIMKDDIVIAQAHNTVLRTNDPTAHTEVNAIRLASSKLKTFDLSECTLYTTCMPCPMCLGAIMWARIKNVYYGAKEEDAAKIGFDDLEFYKRLSKPDKGLNLKQMDYEKNLRLFMLWNQQENKKMY